MYIAIGPPDEIHTWQGGNPAGYGFPHEVWYYRDGHGPYLFADRNRTNDFRLSPDLPIPR